MTVHLVMHFCALFLFGPLMSVFMTPKWPKKRQKSIFFTLQPYHPHFLGSDWLDSMGWYLPHILRQLWIPLVFRYVVVWPLGGPFHRPNCPKWPFFGPKTQFFLARNHFFCGQPQKNCYHYDRTPKRQPFCVDRRSGWSLGGRQGPFLGQKWPENLIFFTLHPHNTPFLVSDGSDSMGS